MPRLNISDRRERAVVAAADVALWPAGLARRAVRKPAITAPGRILCLRLERIGDLIMTMPALAELRALAPAAAIDLAAGRCNRPRGREREPGDRVGDSWRRSHRDARRRVADP